MQGKFFLSVAKRLARMDDAIRADGLTKRYGDVTAVEGLDLSVAGESVYGFLGPNGAGKSTTLALLTGLTRPTAGSATVAGVDVRDRSALVSRIGFAPERPPFYANLTGREQLRCIAEIRDVPDAEDTISAYLDRFDLREAERRRIDGYSTGMRQKLNLIQAVFHDPEVVFFDEPTSGLDPQSTREMRELLVETRDEGATVFLSTHILSVVEAVADEVGILTDGRIRHEGSIDAVLSGAEAGGLEEAFVETLEGA